MGADGVEGKDGVERRTERRIPWDKGKVKRKLRRKSEAADRRDPQCSG
jgi:hypothetical protein